MKDSSTIEQPQYQTPSEPTVESKPEVDTHLLNSMCQLTTGLTVDEERVIRILLKSEKNTPLLFGTFLGEWYNLTGSLNIKNVNRILFYLSGKYGLVETIFLEEQQYIKLTEFGKLYYVTENDNLLVDIPIYLLMDRAISLDNEILYRNIGLTPQTLLNYYDAYRTSSTPPNLFPANITVEDIANVSETLLSEGEATIHYTQQYSYSDAKQTLTLSEPPKFVTPSIQHPTFFENVGPHEVETLLMEHGFSETIQSRYLFVYEGVLYQLNLRQVLDWYDERYHYLLPYLEDLVAKEHLITPITYDIADLDSNDFSIIFDVLNQSYRIHHGEIDFPLERGESIYKIDYSMDWVLVGTNHHIRVPFHKLYSTFKGLKEMNSTIHGLFPIPKYSPNEENDEIYYFINTAGCIKASYTSKLFSNYHMIKATPLKNYERIGFTLSKRGASDKDKILLITKNGYIKCTETSELKPKGRSSRFTPALLLDFDDEIIYSDIISSDTQLLGIHINNVFHNLNIDSITSSKVTKGKHLLPRYETVDTFSLHIQSLNTLLHNPSQEKEMTYKCQ